MIEAFQEWMTGLVIAKDIFILYLAALVLLITNFILIHDMRLASNDRRQVYELLRTVSARIVGIEEKLSK